MRVTQGMLNQQMLFDVQNNYERLSQYQEEVATSNRINKPSDDPIGVGYVMRYTNEVAYNQQNMDNASSAQQWLNYTDSVMNQAGQIMQRARDLAVQGSSDTLSADDRKAIGSEVDQLYQELVTNGNSQYNGKYIFNGEMTTTKPYQGDPTQVIGTTTDNGQVLFDIGDGVHLNVNVPGSTFFGTANSNDNAFSVLQKLETALNSNDSAGINSTLGLIDSRHNQMLSSQSDIGARTNRAQMAQNRLSSLGQSLSTLLVNVQGADLPTVATQLQEAENIQQASLQVGAKVIVPTLVDFLK